MEFCTKSNNSTNSFEWAKYSSTNIQTARPKRDFRFKVIEVRQCPKWFIWPNRNREIEQTIDENHNKEARSVGITSQNYSSSTQFASCSTNHDGYAAMRRNIARTSNRRQIRLEALGHTVSEPDPKVISKKKGKAVTEPISSASSSNTFKILSIAKKWESFDATDEEAESDIASSCKRINLKEKEIKWIEKY